MMYLCSNCSLDPGSANLIQDSMATGSITKLQDETSCRHLFFFFFNKTFSTKTAANTINSLHRQEINADTLKMNSRGKKVNSNHNESMQITRISKLRNRLLFSFKGRNSGILHMKNHQ